jgi:hypothetical protein
MRTLTRLTFAGLVATGVLTGIGLPHKASAQPAPATTPPRLPAFDTEAKRQAIETMAKLMADEYVFPDVGARAAAMLRQNLAAGKYDRLATRADFATQVTQDLQEVVHDQDLRVRGWDQGPPPLPPGAPTQPQEPLPGNFAQVDRLNGNIGYIVFNNFVQKDIWKWAADKAIGLVGSTDALIIDLRNNTGGGDTLSPEYLASFFVDGKTPVHVLDLLTREPGTTDYDRESHSTEPTPVSYLGKPVYLLTSSTTFSGGEAFAYDMQALKRATVVGEATRGGAHGTYSERIAPGLMLRVPISNAVSAITNGNWEGKGVQPDVAVPADQAFTTAYTAALHTLGRQVSAAPATAEPVTEAHLLVVARTTPLPGSEAALRRWIAGVVAGQFPEDLYAPDGGKLTGEMLSATQAGIVQWGALQSLTFVKIALGGGDVYQARFADKSSHEFIVYLDDEGKLLFVL